ncbi:MAG: phosphoenolpyruvate--protein phosphotransferase [Chloroflexota bacterium]
MTTIVQGIGAAPGIAIGPIWLYEPARATVGEPAAAGLDPALAIERATAEAARELESLADRLRAAGRTEEAGIFDAQALMAEDDALVAEAVRRARAGTPLVIAVQEAAAEAAGLLAAVEDELLAARAADVRDVGMRVCRILTGTVIELPPVPSVIVGEDIPPSFSAEIPPGLALGFALAAGSRTAHAVILARSLGLPAIVGAAGVCEAAAEALDGPAAPVTGAMDGETGEVFLDVDETLAGELRARQRRLVERRARAATLREQPGATADGRRVLLVANIGTPDEAARALEAAAEGVGLFRTEFLFLSRASAPTEAEQVAAYRRVLAVFGPDRPVVIRLADIGGDKPIPYLGLPAEANPFLGVRAIRLAYAAPQLLQTQLRAIWRAGGLAGIVPHVMAPMVSTIEDVELLHTLRDAARREVVDAGEPCADAMVTGIMVEVPSAALLAPELAARVDFMSIGTNDLTQYVFAADRGNAALASMQDALHPAVLRAIAMIVAAGREAGIPVAVCGELAGDPAGACVLVGLGVSELSADAASLDELRATLASVSSSELEGLAKAALRAPDATVVRALAESVMAAGAVPG